jgi:aromatic ring-cleaving dioxygenase
MNMVEPSSPPIEISGYHAHVYYDLATRPLAERLAEMIGKEFPVRFGVFTTVQSVGTRPPIFKSFSLLQSPRMSCRG